MTFKEFLKAFKKVARPSSWRVRHDGTIRHRSSGHCPLSWVGSRLDAKIAACDVYDPSQLLGLRQRDVLRIIGAADNCDNRPITRKQLLAAIGR
mgnify:FL=1